MVATRKMNIYRGVAQFGRVLGSGPRGRRFKSSHSDQQKTKAFCLRFFIARRGFEELGSERQPWTAVRAERDRAASSRENQILSLRWAKPKAFCLRFFIARRGSEELGSE